jgi:hypothetical protein
MNLETTRQRGRPRSRWQDEMREDGRIVVEKSDRKKHIKERNGRSSCERQGIVAFAHCSGMNERDQFLKLKSGFSKNENFSSNFWLMVHNNSAGGCHQLHGTAPRTPSHSHTIHNPLLLSLSTNWCHMWLISRKCTWHFVDWLNGTAHMARVLTGFCLKNFSNISLNIPSLPRQRSLPRWCPWRTPCFFCNFSTADYSNYGVCVSETIFFKFTTFKTWK